MTFNEEVAAVAKVSGQSQALVGAILKAATEQKVEALRRGDDVQCPGLGKFQVKHRDQRQGRHPKTNEPITIAARRAVVFKAAKALSDAVA